MSPTALQVKSELMQLDDKMLQAELTFKELLDKVHPRQYKSACNLLHYLTLRCTDIRALQEILHEQGLSSLASAESHIRSQLLAILRLLDASLEREAVLSYKNSIEQLKDNSAIMFGACGKSDKPCIMVTFDTTHADDYNAVKELVQAGMNIARINCAHDDEATWLKMIAHIKKAKAVTGLSCKIYMDLAGPKIRTQLPVDKLEKGKIKIKVGQRLYLFDGEVPEGKKNSIGCSLPGIVPQLKRGEKVLIDDGLIEAKVTTVVGSMATLKIGRISSKKPVVKNEKGINFPDSKLSIPALTPFDQECLPFIQEHADMVGYSFVQNAADVLQLQQAMHLKKLPLVVKVETPEAVTGLPQILFQGMQEEVFGVMIARGDLAVEIGFERMSEIQEEILWICEAGHIPVIWATQVLENLNKNGVATRAEVTDAAHAIMAECVMINKGAHTLEVIKALKDILVRSSTHHLKKRYTFRPLGIASHFIQSTSIKHSNSTPEMGVVTTVQH